MLGSFTVVGGEESPEKKPLISPRLSRIPRVDPKLQAVLNL